jgi:hypothetical protein
LKLGRGANESRLNVRSARCSRLGSSIQGIGSRRREEHTKKAAWKRRIVWKCIVAAIPGYLLSKAAGEAGQAREKSVTGSTCLI